MKNFIIINGKNIFIRNFEDKDKANEWAENHCDHSLEVIVREFITVDISPKFKGL